MLFFFNAVFYFQYSEVSGLLVHDCDPLVLGEVAHDFVLLTLPPVIAGGRLAAERPAVAAPPATPEHPGKGGERAAGQAHALVAANVVQGKVGERARRRFFFAHGGGALETDAAVPVGRALDGGAGGVDDG